MKRNRKKIILSAALCCLLVMLSAACQKRSAEGQADNAEAESGEAESDDSTRELSFEEQYDLGMRLLSEGSYEEAIIAFTAALEIDPRSVDIYTALADAYEAMGDTEGLRRILAQGIEATGDAGLQERLSQLPPQIHQIPQIPGTLEDYDMNSYITVDEELESLFADVIPAVLAEASYIAYDAPWNAELAELAEQVGAYLKKREENSGEKAGSVTETESYTNYGFCTMLPDGAILKFYFTRRNQGLNYWFSYRPERGKGFYLNIADYLAEDHAYYNSYLTQGEVEDWRYNGAYTFGGYHIQYNSEGESEFDIIDYLIASTAVNDLVEGESIVNQHILRSDGFEKDYTVYENFIAGERQITWINEEGEGFQRMYVDETGEVSYRKDPQTDTCTPWTSWF